MGGSADVYTALFNKDDQLSYAKLLVDAITGRLQTDATASGLKVAISHTVQNVTDVAAPLPTVAQSGRNSMEIFNPGTNVDTIWIGNATVTADFVVGTTSGRPVAPGETYTLDITDLITLYARAEAAKIIPVLIVEFA